ncbi:hypothetical protein IJ765_03990 [Candidatus Saccharibacteria bacterium]|nr:hypothetical protein [Candidatus Saccharibacteria bacterium]MBR1796379.1 hypothetical protein [Candidatus Saccharibacteria bacterium]
MKKRILIKKLGLACLYLAVIGGITACGSEKVTATSDFTNDDTIVISDFTSENSNAKDDFTSETSPDITAPEDENGNTGESINLTDNSSTEELASSITDNNARDSASSTDQYFNGEVFELTKFMQNYGFYHDSDMPTLKESGEYSVTFNGLMCYITIMCWPNMKTVDIHARDYDYGASYLSSHLDSDMGQVTTDLEGISLTPSAYDAISKIVPTALERFENNQCPYAGYGIEHSADTPSEGIVSSHAD